MHSQIRNYAACISELGAWLLASALLLIPCLATAMDTDSHGLRMEVITLHYREATELVPALRPLVPAPGSISGHQRKLIVRASPKQLEQLHEAIDALDTAPAMLRISVRNVQDASALQQGIDSSVRIANGNSRGTVTLHRTAVRENARDSQQVQVLEGYPAHIHLGVALPLVEYQLINSALGPVHQETVVYRELASGFYVLPRLSGSQVTVTISPQRESLAPSGGGRIQGQYLSTTVSGQVGEWLHLGGTLADSTQGDNGLLSTRKGNRRSANQVWMKVEILP